MQIDKFMKRFQWFGAASIVIIYLVILAGSIVRGTGAGMGCPDWPKCFGLWIPPTDISQLPPNYQQLFSDGGQVAVEPFNPLKTWTEYINRLIGALSGLSVLITFLLSLPLRKLYPRATFFAFMALILLLIQAWLGAMVVKSNLTPHVITIHMLLALIILFCLFVAMASIQSISKKHLPKGLLLLLFFIMLIQMILGVQVREQIDVIMKQLNYEQREAWLSQVDYIFYVHRSFSWGVLLLSAFGWYRFRKEPYSKPLLFQLLGVVFLMITGISLNYLGFPVWAQPLHLLITMVLLGNLLWQIALIYFAKKF